MTKVKAYYKDGSIELGFSKIKKRSLVEIAKLEIETHKEKKIIEIDDDKELLLYRRVSGVLFPPRLDNITYFVGYKQSSSKYLLSVDSVSGEIVEIADDHLRP